MTLYIMRNFSSNFRPNLVTFLARDQIRRYVLDCDLSLSNNRVIIGRESIKSYNGNFIGHLQVNLVVSRKTIFHT